MRILQVGSILLPLVLTLGACDDAQKTGSESTSQVMLAWQIADIGSVKIKPSEGNKIIADGKCQDGIVAKLHVTLCEFKDAVAADSAKELGLAQIGANTGAALVRERYLLVVADLDKVDVHGKVLNKVAKIFLEPPSPAGL